MRKDILKYEKEILDKYGHDILRRFKDNAVNHKFTKDRASRKHYEDTPSYERVMNRSYLDFVDMGFPWELAVEGGLFWDIIRTSQPKPTIICNFPFVYLK